MSRPDVSIVVRVRDEPRVADAVRSALAQTLGSIEVVVVDHGSTDETPAILRQLAARDPRVRVVTLPDATGGPGRPGNAGIDAARGDYLTFLDSDDELERDACRGLLAAAKVSDADVVTSQARRVLVEEGGRVQRWFPDLYRERRVVDDIRDNPRQIWDQVNHGKLYRTHWLRERGIRIPEGVIYEDQLFLMRAYVRARRIAVVQQATYRWMVRPSAAHLSITHTRSDVQNLLDRVLVNKLIDELLKDEAQDLKPEKDRKFLGHDLRLYLQELWLRDPAYQRVFTETVGAYLESVDDDVVAEQPRMVQVALWLLRRRDLEGALGAYGYVLSPGRVATDLVRRDDRVYWTARHLDTFEGRDRLDVTELGLHRVPPGTRHLYNELAVTGVRGGMLSVQGALVNSLGLVRRDAEDLAVQVLLSPSSAPRSVLRFPATDVVHTGDRIRFRADLDLGAALRVAPRRTQTWNFSVETTWDGIVNVTRTTAPRPAPQVTVPVPSRLALLTGNAVRVVPNRFGNLCLALTNTRPLGARLGDVAAAAARAGRMRAVQKGARRLVEERAKPAYFALCKRLPVQGDTVVFEAFQGRQYADSPRAVYEALRQRRPELPVVWSYAGSRGSDGFPEDAELVRRGSWAYYRTLARARYWVDNYGFPKPCPPRRETTYVQTWHGTPMKMLFFDTLRFQRLSRAEQDFWQEYLDRWDSVVIPNDWYYDTFFRAANAHGQVVRTGLPRNDVLVTGSDAACVARVRRNLGLPDDRRIVLYAPTYRPRTRQPSPFVLPDLEELAAALGDEHYLLLRLHYYRPALSVPASLHWFARDVSRLDETSSLLLAADVLVTDYSSVMFDYAFLRRPMVFYVPDHEHYTQVDPGTYVDLETVAPGPLVRTTEEFADAVARAGADSERWAEAYDRFFARFCAADNGNASETVVRHVWG